MLATMKLPAHELLALLVATSFAAGLNLYATVATLGLLSRAGKTAARAAVTPPPEPPSNITLSLGEDALAISLTWFATKHPYIAAAIVLWLIVVIITLIRWVVRSLRALFRGAEHEIAKP